MLLYVVVCCCMSLCDVVCRRVACRSMSSHVVLCHCMLLYGVVWCCCLFGLLVGVVVCRCTIGFPLFPKVSGPAIWPNSTSARLCISLGPASSESCDVF